MNIITTDSINNKIKANPDEFILNSDNAYYNSVTEIADKIEKKHKQSPIVLLSGPSGSGKTTTALAIESILDRRGIETHTISMDNYFKPLTKRDREALSEGKLDFEAPDRVDEGLLNEQLQQMIDNERVELPKYCFTTNSRKRSGTIIERKPDEIIILEGIHALNPDTIKIDEKSTVGIYVSVRTRVKSDNCLLHPALIRLIRRMIRDKSFRGRAISETLEMFESVERGEERFILPFKHRADFEIDTFFEYELSAYKNIILNDIKQLAGDKKIDEMLNILENLEKIPKSAVPKSSLIREFIGGGNYKY